MRIEHYGNKEMIISKMVGFYPVESYNYEYVFEV